MPAGDRLTLTATQTLVTAPTGLKQLEYVWVSNAHDATVFLSVWPAFPGASTGLGTDRRRGGPYDIPAGFTGVIPIELTTGGAVILSAATATDGTGAPGTALALTPTWGTEG